MEDAKSITQQWVSKMVVDLNLCPFAKPVIENQLMEIEVSLSSDIETLYVEFLNILTRFQETPETQLATLIWVMPNATANYDLFLDWLDLANDSIEQAGLSELIQIAPFHPQFEFDEPEDEAQLMTNRSPFPMFHLLRSSDIDRVMKDESAAMAIVERNQKLLTNMGMDEILKHLGGLAKHYR